MHDPSEMPERLRAFLAVQEPDVDEIVVESYEPMTGGYSRVLARAAVRWRRGGTEEQHTFVLRGDPPPGRALLFSDRAAEWSVLDAVAGHSRIAKGLYFDPTGDALGTIAIVLEHSPATSLLPYCASGGDTAHLPARLAEAAASFHNIPIDQLPAGLDRPPSWDDYLDVRIDEWRRTDREHVESLPVLRYVAEWLDAHRPTPVPLTLIHGDFQSANMLVDDGGMVLLDWELAQIGDPREDLGYFKAVAQAAPPDLTDDESFCARYRELTGLDESQVNPLVVTYFMVLGVIGTARRLFEGGAAFARGDNTSVGSLFNLNSVTFGQMMWLQACRQLEAVVPPSAGRH